MQKGFPLEKKLLANFDLSKFVVCTDAGLSSSSNRRFNNDDKGNRAFVTTQSIKKLKKHLKAWALDTGDWLLAGEIPQPGQKPKRYNLAQLDQENDKEKIYYKSRWVKEDGLEQQLIVTYSLKYKEYQKTVRSRQLERALKAVKKGKSAVEAKRQNDPKRFIRADHATADGEAAEKTAYYIDSDAVKAESVYDGFYAVCPNLEDDPLSIVNINKRRWEIEECFRIMKSDFEARPVYPMTRNGLRLISLPVL